MDNKKTITILVYLIAVLATVATSIGIFSGGGPGTSTITSVRGEQITLYGKGVYHHMSAEVAPQGIAQDVVTLFIAIPLLLTSLFLYRKESLLGSVLLTGTLGYFLVTYLFFTMMAMYNQLFLVWVVLLSLCFYAFLIAFKSLDERALAAIIEHRIKIRLSGGFLIFCSVSIALLWLSIVLPPALSGNIPNQVEHYTTLVVQALDLSILLPASFIAGVLLIRKRPFGFKLSAVYYVFLSILMTALTAKVVAMAILGYNVIPVIFIIPFFNIVSVALTFMMCRHLQKQNSNLFA
jgi:hypothetical protein